MTHLTSGLVRLHWSALTSELGTLRESVDELELAFRREYGPSEEVVARTEALSAALQRLEWAILRRQLRRLAAGSGG